MKIIVLGNGFIAEHLPYERISARHCTDSINTDYLLSKHKPDVIINTCGETGRPNIDNLESRKVETYNANVMLPLRIAEWCEKHSVHFIQLGSGCIYYGQSPNIFPNFLTQANFWSDTETKVKDIGWKETDFANPLSYYSKTKYACDLLLGDVENTTTLRLRMPISSMNSPRNFINKVKNYTQVIDIPNSITIVSDLVRCIDWAAKESKTGIYHVVNPEPTSAAEVMREYQKYVPTHHFEVIDEVQLDKLTTAKRSNCILNSDKLKNAGFSMTPTKEALEQTMRDYIKNQGI